MEINCLTCGKEAIIIRPRFINVPSFIIVPNQYVLCEEHQNISYEYDDIYDDKGERKEINHEEIIKRSMETK